MATFKKKTKRVASGRPDGIPQPKGPERIKRKEGVIWDSLLKRAVAGEAEAVRLCIEQKLIDPNSALAKKVAAKVVHA